MSRLRILSILTSVLLAPALLGQTRHAAYFELGGSAIAPSVNYERRLNENWYGRVGFSFITGETSEDTESTFIVPLTASWVSRPGANHHLEAGGGLTLIAGDSQDFYETLDDDEKFSAVVVTGIFGYRYQRPDGGFQFRSGLTPVIAEGGIYPWFHVSFGYAW
jgi:hypothetical protein